MSDDQDMEDSMANLFNGAQATVDSGTKKFFHVEQLEILPGPSIMYGGKLYQ